jgi:ER lumen protein retaining receptor
MGTYRALYIVNWIYRSAFEPHYHHQWIAYLCGLVQTGLYSDFIYLFVKSKARGEKISLPT